MPIYIVTESYYKHAELMQKVYSTEESVRKAALDFLSECEEESVIDFANKLSTGELLKLAVEAGEKIIEDQAGWGWRAVTRVTGTDLEAYSWDGVGERLHE